MSEALMAAGQPPDAPRRSPSVFLSYASEDRQSVQAIRDALPSLGLDVWYDESALGGGEAWDQKIRRQIRDCDFFMPIISARTEARHEGYFRREWRFAVERTLDMADDHVFLVPVVIDETVGETARVPEKFLTVQWLRLPDGRPTPAFEAMCRRLASGQATEVPPPKKADFTPPKADKKATSAPAQYPEFPRQEPGQSARFYGQTAVWTVQSAWVAFNRLPRWVRVLAYIWLFVLLIQRCQSSSSSDEDKPPHVAAPPHVTRSDARKIKDISEQYLRGSDKADLAGLAEQIARQFPEHASPPPGAGTALLAIPFRAPAGDLQAKKLADGVFAQVYGQLAIAQHGKVRLEPSRVVPVDPAAAAERGRANHASYVVYGAINNQTLDVKVIESEDGSVIWSKSYPVQGADAATIAAEVQSKVPPPDAD
ncbi:MAG: toll/interleukin-1 receptor domain-containing protein [Proteobacteria bacterium]|nr:toll/interleukin-1 receptor domain-containing protein [Pseudomonadota bacterium]